VAGPLKKSTVLLPLAESLSIFARGDGLRFFGGLNVEETAHVLHIAPITVRREWNSAKVWLYKAVTSGQSYVSPDRFSISLITDH
jgi:hypothetical protein